jgi:preprotein translocase subunit SecG
MYEILIFCDILVAVTLVLMILMQQSKGADAGMSMSGQSSGSFFGARSAANALTKITGLLATAFFVLSLIIGRMNSQVVTEQEKVDTMVESLEASTEDSVIPD